MVKVGFIVEGDSEKILFESKGFQDTLTKLGIQFVAEVINAKGNGNLLPKNIGEHEAKLAVLGANRIIVVTDKDQSCFTQVKARIQPTEKRIVIAAAVTIESWYLADSDVMTRLLGSAFNCANPESYPNPYDQVKAEFLSRGPEGPGRKPSLATKVVDAGWNLERAATHGNCPSAKYFLDKLAAIAIS